MENVTSIVDGDIRKGKVEMEDLSRVLITTSDERTWKLNHPVIFLGEWCRLYEQRHTWEDLDAIVASPYGLDLASKISDYQEVRYIEKILLSKASEILNEVHSSAHNERFWKIVIGHWLRTFVQSGLNRYKTIKKCIEENKISSSTFIKISDENLICLDFDSFNDLLDDPMWSSSLDYRRNTWDSTMEYHKLFNHKIIFLSQIRNTINQDITVRLHPRNHFKFQPDIRYYKSDPTLKIDKGYSKLDSLIPRNRLLVFSYESTGVIENLIRDIPTMALFLDGFECLSDEAKTHYRLLADVGIFHVSVESAAQKICTEWDNITSWWDDPIVQTARINFCNQYGKTSRKPIRELRKIIMEEH